MEAKDTVIEVRELARMTQHILADNEWAGELQINRKIAEVQAEISFKAGRDSRKGEIEGLMALAFTDGERMGKQDGRREVVEWIKENRETPLGKWGL